LIAPFEISQKTPEPQLPQHLLNAFHIVSVKRKAAKLPPCSQQEIVHDLLERWLKEQAELP
jgi:hypothetical protein